jgi:hypothetical protein
MSTVSSPQASRSELTAGRTLDKRNRTTVLLEVRIRQSANQEMDHIDFKAGAKTASDSRLISMVTRQTSSENSIPLEN